MCDSCEIQHLVRKNLHKDLMMDFLTWAFGESFVFIYSSIEFMNSWNDRHADLLLLSGNSRPENDIPKMINIWMDQTWEDLEKNPLK